MKLRSIVMAAAFGLLAVAGAAAPASAHPWGWNHYAARHEAWHERHWAQHHWYGNEGWRYHRHAYEGQPRRYW